MTLTFKLNADEGKMKQLARRPYHMSFGSRVIGQTLTYATDQLLQLGH